ncbi:hypothetical protein [Marinobacter oulmenensis]|uniref:Uncharacterized protein n=1 Tax=Marinobacter oulmenensis TaxID=643747 RepID=A0A840UHM8_9GAMM|nr:hypothetical protein [Marinobacter oulmenensis]MBB5320308.1 hypothetical protein [Marinobacter oulmenensis]
MQKKRIFLILLTITLALYILSGVVFNPMIIWTAGPVFLSYPLLNHGLSKGSKPNCYGAYAYLLGSSGFSLAYHLAWFFDWGGTKTGGSTSALIFAVFPVYAVFIGSLLWPIGYAVGYVSARKP